MLVMDDTGVIILANAVVERACKDYVKWKMFIFRHPDTDKSLTISYGEEAERFLRSERLCFFTDVSGEYLLSKLDVKIAEKQKRILEHKKTKEQKEGNKKDGK